jgi:hypothetical protein
VRRAQLYSQASGLLFLAFYDLQGYGENVLTSVHSKSKVKVKISLLQAMEAHRVARG